VATFEDLLTRYTSKLNWTADGNLKLRIKLEQFDCQEKVGKQEWDQAMERASNMSLVTEIGSLLDSKSLSDFKIQMEDGTVFDVHRLILKGNLKLVRMMRIDNIEYDFNF
jgi:hypothetical protein